MIQVAPPTPPTPPTAAPRASKQTQRSRGRTHLADAFCAHRDESPASAQTPRNRGDAVLAPALGTAAFGSVHFKHCFHSRLLLVCVRRALESHLERVSKPLSYLGFWVFVRYGRGVVEHYRAGNELPRYPCSWERSSCFILDFKAQTSTSHTASPSSSAV